MLPSCLGSLNVTSLLLLSVSEDSTASDLSRMQDGVLYLGRVLIYAMTCLFHRKKFATQCLNTMITLTKVSFNIACLYILHTTQSMIANPTSIEATYGEATPRRQGWTSQPSQRGTLDIIWDCGFTMGLCSWSLLCLNIPPQEEKDWYRWRRKFYLTCLTLLAPEWMFQLSMGQWIAARHSVKKFHAAGHTGWTMKHAFFANMGGFVFQAKDSAASGNKNESITWTAFPVNAEQLLYLIEHGYVKYPTITKRLIKEKDKMDTVLRLLTLCQILWFVVNISARAAQHLTVTCIEITTAAFIFSALGIVFCWAHKPADLVLPEIIRTEASIQEILINAGEKAQKPYLRTPLDFVDYEEWSLSLYFQHCVNILRYMRIPLGLHIVPITGIENTFNLWLPHDVLLGILLFSCSYVALFFAAWNYSFPTHIEQTLWRAAVLVMLGTIPTFWATTEWCFYWYPSLRVRFNIAATDRMNMKDAPRCREWPGHGRLARRARSLFGHCINNSASKHEKLDIPLKAIFPMYILGFLYCNARTYIFAADLMELRLLPSTAYDTVNWSSIVPHF